MEAPFIPPLSYPKESTQTMTAAAGTAGAGAGAKAEAASGSNIPLQNASDSIPQKPVVSNPHSDLFTNGLAIATGAAFMRGAFESLGNQGRQEKRKGISMSQHQHHLPMIYWRLIVFSCG